jgi:hypothetical protein
MLKRALLRVRSFVGAAPRLKDDTGNGMPFSRIAQQMGKILFLPLPSLWAIINPFDASQNTQQDCKLIQKNNLIPGYHSRFGARK